MQTSSYCSEEELNAITAWLLSLPDNMFDMEPVPQWHQEIEEDEAPEENIEAWLQLLPEDLSELEPVLEPYQEDESGKSDCMLETVQKWLTLPEGWPRRLAYHPAMYQEILEKAYGS